MKAIEKDGYLYDPPSWKVCDRCKGTGTEVEVVRDWPHGVKELWACSKCADSPKPGYLPVRYTPKEWVDAGGVLTDNTPVWIQAKNGQWMEGLYWEHDENSHGTPFIIATSAGRPEVEK